MLESIASCLAGGRPIIDSGLTKDDLEQLISGRRAL